MAPDLAAVTWRKASRSGGEGGNCVELAWPSALRDSKNPDGPVIKADWSELVAVVKAGHLTR